VDDRVLQVDAFPFECRRQQDVGVETRRVHPLVDRHDHLQLRPQVLEQHSLTAAGAA